MALWDEHLGRLEDCMQEPGTPECVARVRQLAKVPVSCQPQNRSLLGHVSTVQPCCASTRARQLV